MGHCATFHSRSLLASDLIRFYRACRRRSRRNGRLLCVASLNDDHVKNSQQAVDPINFKRLLERSIHPCH